MKKRIILFLAIPLLLGEGLFQDLLAARLGPAGGAVNSGSFDDEQASQGLGSITQVNIWHGDVMDAIQAVYNGKKLSGPGSSPSSTATFSSSDPLVEVSGFYGNWYGATHLGGVYLKSRSGKSYGPYGSGGGFVNRTPFSLKAPQGQEIKFFFGGNFIHSGGDGYLSSLGVGVGGASQQAPAPVPAPAPAPVPVPVPAPVPASPASAPVVAKPDLSAKLQRIKNSINDLKEERDRLLKEIETLKQSLANLKSGAQDPAQAMLDACEQSKAGLAKRLAFVEQDRQELQVQLEQALVQLKMLMDRVKQGKSLSIELIEEKAPMAAVPVTELFVPAAQAQQAKKIAAKKAKKKKAKKKKAKKVGRKKGKKASDKKTSKKKTKSISKKKKLKRKN